MLDSPVAVERSPRLRSRVTNGSMMVAGLDGRGAAGRRYRDLCISLAVDLGGSSSLTEAQRALVWQAAAMILQSEKLQGEVLRGEVVDCEQLNRLANVATRILSRLGVKRAVVAPSLNDRIAARYPAARLPGRTS